MLTNCSAATMQHACVRMQSVSACLTTHGVVAGASHSSGLSQAACDLTSLPQHLSKMGTRMRQWGA